MKFSTRIWIIIFAALLSMVLLASIAIQAQRSAMMEERRNQLDKLVSLAYAAVEKLHQRELTGELSREEAQSQARMILSSYHKAEDYFFVRDYSTDVLLVHPNPNRLGATPSTEAVQKGDEYRQAIAQSPDRVAYIISKDGTRPGVAGKVEKLYGVRKFEAWGWLMGFGEYIDDIESDFWDSVALFIASGSGLLLVLTTLTLRMRRAIFRDLGGEPSVVADRMRKIAGGDLTVEIYVPENDTHSLMASLKVMQMKLKNLTSSIHENASSLVDQAKGFEAAAKSYTETRSDTDLSELVRGVRKLGKTTDILLKSVSRFKS